MRLPSEDSFDCNSVERTQVYDYVSILSCEIRAWYTRVKTCNDAFEGDINEPIDLSLGIHRRVAHLVIQIGIAPTPVGTRALKRVNHLWYD